MVTSDPGEAVGNMPLVNPPAVDSGGEPPASSQHVSGEPVSTESVSGEAFRRMVLQRTRDPRSMAAHVTAAAPPTDYSEPKPAALQMLEAWATTAQSAAQRARYALRPEVNGGLLLLAAVVTLGTLIMPISPPFEGQGQALSNLLGAHALTASLAVGVLGVLVASRRAQVLRRDVRMIIGWTMVVVFSAGALSYWHPTDAIGLLAFAEHSAGGRLGEALVSTAFAQLVWVALPVAAFATLRPETAARTARRSPAGLHRVAGVLWMRVFVPPLRFLANWTRSRWEQLCRRVTGLLPQQRSYQANAALAIADSIEHPHLSADPSVAQLEIALGLGHLPAAPASDLDQPRRARPSRRTVQVVGLTLVALSLLMAMAIRPQTTQSSAQDLRAFMADVPTRVETFVRDLRAGGDVNDVQVVDEVAVALEAATAAASQPLQDELVGAAAGTVGAAQLVISGTGGVGIAVRSGCSDDARSGGALAEGTVMTVVAEGAGSCAGWSLVETSDGATSTWVRQSFLATVAPS